MALGFPVLVNHKIALIEVLLHLGVKMIHGLGQVAMSPPGVVVNIVFPEIGLINAVPVSLLVEFIYQKTPNNRCLSCFIFQIRGVIKQMTDKLCASSPFEVRSSTGDSTSNR